jgi:protein-S-isoprenylcysteine O-methyltransferase Ste14
MARRWFKRFVPWPIERSVYLLATSFILLALFIKWEPMPKSVWFLRTAWPFQFLHSLAGALVIWATVAQGALHFFGFQQVWAYVRGRTYSRQAFVATGPYRYTRHPQMIGTLTVFLGHARYDRGPSIICRSDDRICTDGGAMGRAGLPPLTDTVKVLRRANKDLPIRNRR